MKRTVLLLLLFAFLLVGCQNTDGVLVVPASPSADLPERPGTEHSDPSVVSEETSDETQPPSSERSLTFSATETDGLQRLQTRKGDLEVLGMAYGDGCFAALTVRESGTALTVYDESGAGIFAGILSESFSDPLFLGYAGGCFCLYCEKTATTFACASDETYKMLSRKGAEQVLLYKNGFVLIGGGTAALCAPCEEEPTVTYPLSDGATWLAGDEERALISRGGQLFALLPDGTETPLSDVFSWENGVLRLQSSAQTVYAEPYCTAAYRSDCVSVLASSDGCTAELAESGIRFILPKDGLAFTVNTSSSETFRFGGKTENGVLFSLGGEWYLLSEGAFRSEDLCTVTYEGDSVLFAAGQVLCKYSVNRLAFSASGAPFALSPAVAGFTAYRVTDGELLFRAAALLTAETAALESPPHACIYLCSRVEKDGEQVPYTLFQDGGTSGVLLDVSDPVQLSARLNAILNELVE